MRIAAEQFGSVVVNPSRRTRGIRSIAAIDTNSRSLLLSFYFRLLIDSVDLHVTSKRIEVRTDESPAGIISFSQCARF